LLQLELLILLLSLRHLALLSLVLLLLVLSILLEQHLHLRRLLLLLVGWLLAGYANLLLRQLLKLPPSDQLSILRAQLLIFRLQTRSERANAG
jgi:hypothetical protein